MANELQRLQFERAKQRFEVKAKEAASRKWWRYGGRLALASLVFLGGAAVEAGTKFFKESIPPKLKDGLCYMSDVLRSNDYPHQFTIVLLPFKNDKDDYRSRVAASLRATPYDVNIILPCEPVELGVKGGRLSNKRAFERSITDTFEKYAGDLVVIGEVKQKKPMLAAFTKREIKRQPELEKLRSDPSLPNLTAKLDNKDVFNVDDSENAIAFLRSHISNSLQSTLLGVSCSTVSLMECIYPEFKKIPDEVLQLISKVGMVFGNEGGDEREWLDKREDTALWENRDFSGEVNKYHEGMKDTATVAMRPMTLPIMLNLVYGHGHGTYVDSNGRKHHSLIWGVT
jgi:hypothetical protein